MEKFTRLSTQGDEQSSVFSCTSKHTLPSSNLGFFYLRPTSGSLGEPQQLMCLRSDRLYTIGRKRRHCEIIFNCCCISRRHCHIFLDSVDRRLRLVDGIFLSRDSDLGEIRRRLQSLRHGLGFRVSLNGVTVNRTKLQRGAVTELSEGDEVTFGCGSIRSAQRCASKHGFVVENISFSCLGGSLDISRQLLTRAYLLQSICRRDLRSEDPIKYICCSLKLNFETKRSIHGVRDLCVVASFPVLGLEGCCRPNDNTANCVKKAIDVKYLADDTVNAKAGLSSPMPTKKFDLRGKLPHPRSHMGLGSKFSNGQTFFLNRLEFLDHGSSFQHNEVTLMELLDPVESLVRVFIATFTCDVSWFLSYCQIPNHLPVTIACHNTEKCWSSSYHDRVLAPYSNYPNLFLVYPQFPDEIAFDKDRSKKGVACHHPKLLILQRKESVRVVITSANLVSQQWNQITNTVWWQDFPRRDALDYSSLFATIKDSKSDFAAQLVGFIASLITNVPNQAHWIKELAGFDFGGAAAYLIASIPGMHTLFTNSSGVDFFHPLEHAILSNSATTKYLGSVYASVVGLSYRFHNETDSRGNQLKKLASFFGRFQESSSRLVEVVLKRNPNNLVDANATSILVCNFDEIPNGDSIHLGFLHRDVAKWAAPLCDNGILEISGFVCPKETLAAALNGNNNKVLCLLSITQGPNFSEISRIIQPEHFSALCLFIASIQRCLGLLRLKEVLSRYKWPECVETEFIYASSSVGTSMNPQFLAAFSSAAGKKSLQISESEESDPDWGRWSTDHEVRSPSISILFPTIERVKSSVHGIQFSKCLLSFSEKTWQRLRTAGIFSDAIPNPAHRIGYPMHVKVARRRFQSQRSASSFGWIYCGSHNFSPAAWGSMLLSPFSGSRGSIVSGTRLRLCNYELGVILIIPPIDSAEAPTGELRNLDDIELPFVVPAPRYGHRDRPATARAMRESLAEFANHKQLPLLERYDEEIADEEDHADEECVGPSAWCAAEESEDDKIYAEMLWSQIDSSDGF